MSPVSKVEKSDGQVKTMPRLDDVLAAVRDTNPFASNRINEPSRYDVDVPAIHAASFDRLTALAGQALRDRSGIGAMLLGSAGIGKSHLLSRLYRWAGETAKEGGPRACYVYVHNILADPDRMPRYMLKYVVSRLSQGGHGPLHQTPLFRFVENAIRHAVRAGGANPNDGKAVHDAFRSCFGNLAGGKAAYETLYQFLRFARPEKVNDPKNRRLASEAVAWLSGDEIDPDAARWLGLRVVGQKPVMLEDDEEVKQVLLALTNLALVSNQPFILCIDQVDIIDPDKVKSLTRFLHALIEDAKNLLVITSGVKQTLLEFQEHRIIAEATWQRIAQFKVELLRVSEADARKILEARLERFQEPFLPIEAVKRHILEDPLFPLGRAWLRRQFGELKEFRPRDVLTWARDAWEEVRAELARVGAEQWLRNWPDHDAGPGPVVPPPDPTTPQKLETAIDGAVDRKIAEQVAQHRLQPGSLPPDAGNLAGLVETLLAQCKGDGLPYTFRGVERMKKKAGVLPHYDLLVRERREPDGREVTTGVLFVTNVGLSATAALKRLLEDDKPPDHRLLVTDHERRPLKVGQQGVEYYRDLEKLGHMKFEHLKINFEQYAGLDALSEVIGMAKSGDLEIEAPKGAVRPVTDTEVIASHHRQDRFRKHPLLRPLLTEEPTPGDGKEIAREVLKENEVRQYVVAHLAWKMGSSASALARGFLETPSAPKAAFEAVWPQFKKITEKMHVDGLVHATPHDNDLFLLLR
jgi:hypothetical protein